MKPTLVIISGPPGAGKTTMAGRVGAALGLPVVSRDGIKEGVSFTTGATHGRGTSEGMRLFNLFYEVVDAHLERGISLVVEAAFHAEVAPDELRQRATAADLVLIRCHAPQETWLGRFRARGRRPGHRDWEFIALMESGDGPTSQDYLIDLGDVPVLDVDTSSSPGSPELDEVVDFIRRCHSRFEMNEELPSPRDRDAPHPLL